MRLNHPKVQLSFSELVTEAAVRAIRSDGLDVAVVTSLGQSEGLEVEPLYDEPLCYVQKSSNGSPDFRSGSLGGDLIMPRDAGWRRQLSINPTASIVEVDSMQPIAAMVKLGLGAALMPSVVAGYLLDAHLKSTPIPGLELRRMLAWSAEKRPSRAVVLHKLMEELLTGQIEEHPLEIESRAAELLSQLGATPASAQAREIAETALGTLALPAIKERRSRIVPEISVYGALDDGAYLSGRADAVTYADGEPEIVFDWKSDVAPSDADRRAYQAQARSYARAVGAKRAAVIYMTLGQVHWVERS